MATKNDRDQFLDDLKQGNVAERWLHQILTRGAFCGVAHDKKTGLDRHWYHDLETGERWEKFLPPRQQAEEKKPESKPNAYVAARCGIYAIRCLVDGRMYIGSSIDMPVRWTGHRNSLKRGRHYNRALLAAWKEHGEDAFTFKVLKLVEPSQLLLHEQAFIEQYGTCDPQLGFNATLANGTRPRG